MKTAWSFRVRFDPASRSIRTEKVSVDELRIGQLRSQRVSVLSARSPTKGTGSLRSLPSECPICTVEILRRERGICSSKCSKSEPIMHVKCALKKKKKNKDEMMERRIDSVVLTTGMKPPGTLRSTGEAAISSRRRMAEGRILSTLFSMLCSAFNTAVKQKGKPVVSGREK